MGWRFRRSFRIAPGVRLNVSSRGLSTTLGGRGASVNIGPRGTYLNTSIPGTGLSYRERLGGGSAEAARVDGAAARAQGGGCLAAVCLGFLGMVLIGMCADGGADPGVRPVSGAAPLYTAAPIAQDESGRDWLYVHGTLNVRSAPNRGAPILGTLGHGDHVQLGPKDARGWARLYFGGPAGGYVYRASDLVQSRPPGAHRSTAPSGSRLHGSGSGSRGAGSRGGSRVYHTGPRGGCYYINGSGNKSYVDRDLCR